VPVSAAISLKLRPFQLVGDEHLALLRRQLRERQLQLVQKHAPRVERVRAGVRRRQQVVQPASSLLVRQRRLAQALRLFLRKRSVMRLRATRNSQPVTCSIGISRRFASTSAEKHVLQNVLGVARIGHSPSDELEEPPSRARPPRDPPVFLERHPRQPSRVVHLRC
jgi:hypothetical protein